jgi:hypothetical protein
MLRIELTEEEAGAVALFARLPIPPYLAHEQRELVRTVLDRVKDAHDSITESRSFRHRDQGS